MTPRVVAALYVDPLGPYPGMPGVECWGRPEVEPRQLSMLHRDARRYAGPHPVVAHPPCGPWGTMRHLAHKQDASCALRAVEQVRAFGGVLEHPAGSKLWEAVALPRPGQPEDQHGGRTIAVNQVDWGHVACKHTWLYLVGVPDAAIECRSGGVATHVVAWRSQKAIATGLRECSAEKRRRTPPDFARYLVKLARAAAESRAA